MILLSGSHLHKEAVLKIAACVSSFVDKPLFLGDLLTQVHDLLRDAHKGREASSDQSLCPITEEKVIVGVVEDQHALIKSAE